MQAVKAVDAQDNVRAIVYLVYLSSRQCQSIYSSLQRIGCFCSKWFPASNAIHGSCRDGDVLKAKPLTGIL